MNRNIIAATAITLAVLSLTACSATTPTTPAAPQPVTIATTEGSAGTLAAQPVVIATSEGSAAELAAKPVPMTSQPVAPERSTSKAKVVKPKERAAKKIVVVDTFTGSPTSAPSTSKRKEVIEAPAATREAPTPAVTDTEATSTQAPVEVAPTTAPEAEAQVIDPVSGLPRTPCVYNAIEFTPLATIPECTGITAAVQEIDQNRAPYLASGLTSTGISVTHKGNVYRWYVGEWFVYADNTENGSVVPDVINRLDAYLQTGD